MYPAVRGVIVSELVVDDLTTAGAFESGASAVVRKTQMARELPATVLALFRATAGSSLARVRSESPRG
jgi:hypothetical protein